MPTKDSRKRMENGAVPIPRSELSALTGHRSLIGHLHSPLSALWSLCTHRSLLVEDVLSLSHRSQTDVSQLSLSSLSLTEISLPNPKSLSSIAAIAAATRPSALPSPAAGDWSLEALSRRRTSQEDWSYIIKLGALVAIKQHAFTGFLAANTEFGGTYRSVREVAELYGSEKSFVVEVQRALSRLRYTALIALESVGISDEEIYQYYLNLKEHVPSRRSTRLPSRSKHGQKFRATAAAAAARFGPVKGVRLCAPIRGNAEVFYFQNFLLCPISSSLLSSLASIDWKSFGLNVKSSAIDEDGDAVLEWENLPPLVHISHCKAAPDLIYGCVPPLLLSLLS
ncbi:hypothetical protein Syun_007022 [Stephania yunnanensis]|uniref:Uncharacterized protein n=1 Tax=Stephania yunnanensis TaxID=152371 RepID=A0AAP0KY04_9MAGN